MVLTRSKLGQKVKAPERYSPPKDTILEDDDESVDENWDTSDSEEDGTIESEEEIDENGSDLDGFIVSSDEEMPPIFSSDEEILSDGNKSD